MAEQEFKYLAMNDWNEYQTSIKNREWIKDSVGQSDRSKFASLSFFERGLLQELRRVRGRTGMNIENDITHIALATHAKATDRAHIGHAIDTLIARRILILTNEQVTPLEERRGDKKREDKNIENHGHPAPTKRPEKSKPICTETSSVQAVIYLPLNSGKEFPITDSEFARWKHLYPAVDVLQQLRAMVGWLESHPTRKKTDRGIKAFVNSWLSRAQDKGVKGNGNGNSSGYEQTLREFDAEERSAEASARNSAKAASAKV